MLRWTSRKKMTTFMASFKLEIDLPSLSHELKCFFSIYHREEDNTVIYEWSSGRTFYLSLLVDIFVKISSQVWWLPPKFAFGIFKNLCIESGLKIFKNVLVSLKNPLWIPQNSRESQRIWKNPKNPIESYVTQCYSRSVFVCTPQKPRRSLSVSQSYVMLPEVTT